MDVNTVFEVAIKSMWNNTINAYNIVRMRVDASAGVTDAQCLADMQTWLNNVLAQMDDIQSSLIKYKTSAVNEVYPTPRAIGTLTAAVSQGAKSQSVLPIGVVVRACQKTGRKWKVSEKFLCGCTTDFISSGAWTSAFMTQAEEAFYYMTNAFTISTHHYTPGHWSVLHTVFTPFTHHVIDPLPCYYLRRVPRRG